jgi:hypothetical protein
MNPWKIKEINILKSGIPVDDMLTKLPERTLAAIKHMAAKLGIKLASSGIKGRYKWEAWELDVVLGPEVTVEEASKLLPLRSPSSIRLKIAKASEHTTEKTVKVSAPVRVRAGWSNHEVKIISKDASAESLTKLLPGRSVWSINAERRRRNLDRPRIGRRTLLVADFPKVDWSQSVSSIARQVGVSWMTASRLKSQISGV